LFGINRQVYYRKIEAKKRNELKVEQVISMIREIRLKMPRLGTRKLYHILEPKLVKLNIGRDKLFQILGANHLLITPKRNYIITTNTHHRFQKHKDLIQDIELKRPEQVWVSDITYLGTRSNHMYLSLITDAYSKKIVGYYVSNNLNTTSSIQALLMAIKSRKYKTEKLIHHSDKGIQYCSNDYQEILNKNKILCSMTERYDPYSNAIAERINGVIKNEFLLENYNLELVVMRKIVKESIEIYNEKRPHYSCNYLTPNQMHNQNSITIKSYKTKSRCQKSMTSA
jgi:putative transposase